VIEWSGMYKRFKAGKLGRLSKDNTKLDCPAAVAAMVVQHRSAQRRWVQHDLNNTFSEPKKKVMACVNNKKT
jgi:hypothetical protein